MEYFIILKQIVDIIYEFQILDYLMVGFAFVLFIYAFVKKGIYKDIKNFVNWNDLIVLVICLLFTISFFDNIENSYSPYFKTISVFAMYFLGRVYGEDIIKNKKAIAVFSYILIYVNLIFRIVEYVHERMTGEFLPRQKWDYIASGGLYYYKTDLAMAVVISVIFIYAFAKNTWFKYFTVFVTSFLIVFSSGARMGQGILLLEYLFIIVFELRTRLKKNWHIKISLVNIIGIILMILLTVAFIILQFSIVKETKFEELTMDYVMEAKLEALFHSRHVIWWDAMNYFANQKLLVRVVGKDLWSCSIRNHMGDRFHCLYFKNIYSIGYLGSYLYLFFVVNIFRNLVKKRGAVIKYMTVAFWIMFLLISATMEAFEYTQMAWFPFLFAGAIVSGRNCEV